MRLTDMTLIFCYALSTVCMLYILFTMHNYFRRKFHDGVVSAALLVGMLFFTTYVIERVAGFIIRFGKVSGWSGDLFLFVQQWGWMASVLGTTISLCVLALMVQGKDLGVFFQRSKGRDKG